MEMHDENKSNYKNDMNSFAVIAPLELWHKKVNMNKFDTKTKIPVTSKEKKCLLAYFSYLFFFNIR